MQRCSPTARWSSGSPPRPGPAPRRGWRHPRSTPTPGQELVERRVRRLALRHPAGRPGPPRTRRDRPEDRSPGRVAWTKSSCSPTERSRGAARELPRRDVRCPRQSAGRGLRFETALARELARRPAPRGVLAHMCPIYAVLAAPLARAVRLRFCSGSPTGGRATAPAAERLSTRSSASTDARSRCRPGRCASRPRHRPDGVPVPRAARQRPPARTRTRQELAGEGIRDADPGGRIRAGVRLTCTARPDGRGAATSRGAAEPRRRRRRVARRGPPLRNPLACSAAPTSSLNNNRTGAADKVVYEACASCVPAFASDRVVRVAAAGAAPVRPRGRRWPGSGTRRLRGA